MKLERVIFSLALLEKFTLVLNRIGLTFWRVRGLLWSLWGCALLGKRRGLSPFCGTIGKVALTPCRFWSIVFSSLRIYAKLGSFLPPYPPSQGTLRKSLRQVQGYWASSRPQYWRCFSWCGCTPHRSFLPHSARSHSPLSLQRCSSAHISPHLSSFEWVLLCSLVSTFPGRFGRTDKALLWSTSSPPHSANPATAPQLL